MNAGQDEQALRAAFADYLRRTNTHDFEAVRPCISPAAEYRFGTQVHRGHAELRCAFEAAWARIEDEHYGATDLQILALQGDLAVLGYRYHWTGRLAGQLSAGGGMGTNLLRREGGRWRISYEHLSLGPVRPVSPQEAELMASRSVEHAASLP